ncbi:MAG: V-type ATP synthase subunit A, partial [Candidatus Omnitrophota bacterium]
GDAVSQMMKVVGEEGTSLEDFVIFLKSDFFDNVYLQQNGFDKVDAATPADRQEYVFKKTADILKKEILFKDKADARQFFYNLRHKYIDWNYKEWQSKEFKKQEQEIDGLVGQAEQNKNDER